MFVNDFCFFFLVKESDFDLKFNFKLIVNYVEYILMLLFMVLIVCVWGMFLSFVKNIYYFFIYLVSFVNNEVFILGYVILEVKLWIRIVIGGWK